MSILPVIAAIDGSDDGLRALDWARDTARGRDAPLRVVHVRQYAPWPGPDVPVAGPPDPDDDPVLDAARARLDERGGGPAAEYVTLEGAPAVALPQLSAGARSLVLGSRGRGGFASLLLGSTSLAAARDARCPVVVVPRPGREVRAPAPDAGPGPRVVVGLHVEGPDEATLDFAFTEAAVRDARLQVVAAYPWPVQTWMTPPGQVVAPVIDEAAVAGETRVLAEGLLAPHRGRHPGVRAETHALPGDAAGNLVAASQGADLVVVGRHRRRPPAPARLMGSVAHAVLLHAAAPVAVVPPAPPDE